ncbi:MAG: Ig-like domain-containing protein [Gammaproteobacteria bacterium]|nr:Ig-like domain-containing protein [Gammaproteobacteria bacterium]
MLSKHAFSTLQTWLVLGLLGTLGTACGGGSEGRDPVLGNDGNVALAPTVTAVSPAAGATGVAVDIAAITATFSEPMEAITGDASFTVTCAAPCTSPTGSTTLDAAGTTASFTLDGPLEHSTTYTADDRRRAQRGNRPGAGATLHLDLHHHRSATHGDGSGAGRRCHRCPGQQHGDHRPVQ